MCSRYIIYVLFPKEMFLQKKEKLKRALMTWCLHGVHNYKFNLCDKWMQKGQHVWLISHWPLFVTSDIKNLI